MIRSIVRRLLRSLPAAAAALALALAFTPAAAAADDAAPVRSPHGTFREDCQLCHNAKDWAIVRVSPKFEHARYGGFELKGAHAATTCLNCHKSLDFSKARPACNTCHADPHRGETGSDCGRCHSTRSFLDRAPMIRAHAETRLPLTGGHASLECENCHKPAAQGQMQLRGTAVECSGCHMADYRNARSPDHVAGGLPLDCRTCHGVSSWLASGFDHQKFRFALTGGHRALRCEQCHANNQYTATATDCYACHAAKFAAATPPHTPANFPASQCASCHTTTTWNAPFDHTSGSTFPLTGTHVSTPCAQCHGDGVYVGKNGDCYSCHQPAYASASPVHVLSAFPAAQCASCHGTTVWSGGLYDHSATPFPLTGAHVTTSCVQCHGDAVYQGKSGDCYSCHTAPYAAAQPPHTVDAFPTSQCAACHGTRAWTGGLFDHTSRTRWPLTGAHVTTTCVQCHGDGVYAAKPTDCYACHQAAYATAQPPHDSVNYPAAGCVCHTTATWLGAKTFDHAAAGFTLIGGHAMPPRACADCHSGGYVTTSSSCYSCHADKYAAGVPKHTPAFFPTDKASCIACHPASAYRYSGWSLAKYPNHTWFPITSGRHNGISCMACHTANDDLSRYACARACHSSSLATQHRNITGFSLATVEQQCYSCHPTGVR